ncbi:MAG: ABC transporter ATP-binding protein [Armatimonadetes bacterium]|nr:ABC transporter ATP-binding protein [Armatimonadota bacterium]
MKRSLHRGLIRYALPHWKTIALALAVVLITSATDLLRPWPSKVLVDNVLGPHPLPGMFKPIARLWENPQIAALWIVSGFYLLTYLFAGITGLVSTYTSIRLGQRMVHDLRSDLFDHLTKLGLRFHDSRNVGDTIYRLTSDTWAVQTYLIHGLFPILTAFVSLVGVFAVMVRLDWQLTVLSLMAVPCLFLTIHGFSKKISQYSTKLYQEQSDLTSHAQQTMSAVRVIKAFVREEFERRRFDRRSEDSLDAGLRLYTLQAVFSLAVNVLSGVGTAAVVWVGVSHALAGQVTPGVILVFIAYLGSLYGPITSMSQTVGTLQSALAAAKRVFDVLDEDPDVKDPPRDLLSAAHDPKIDGKIEFRNVSFGYEPENPVLRGVSFAAEPGEVIAVVGSTGAGKSTLVSLIPRFYDPDEGQVLLDGCDLKSMRVKFLRENVSLVLQESVLFSTSIVENIAYGRLNAAEDEIIEAAKAANAHEFILALPEGYNTQVGERGQKLSGGERQRIAIARAFLKDAPILILDEPTSSLDSATEYQILEALERLMKGKTTFIVTHRLSTIAGADRIVVLKHGRVVEIGTHDELQSLGGIYSELFERQMNMKTGGSA